MVVLAIVAAETEPTYGYRIAQCLKEAGMGQIKGGTLYPILARMEADGFLVSTWGDGEGGPGRKFITITPTGRSELERRSGEWRAFVGTVLNVLPGEHTSWLKEETHDDEPDAARVAHMARQGHH